jgi:hypothetical protein
MQEGIMNAVLKVTILLGCSAATTLVYAGGQAPSKSQDGDGVREAIRFERAKDAADARQVRIEAGRTEKSAVPTAAASTSADNERDRMMTSEDRVGDEGVQEAIRFERAKDAADARQARIEARQGNAVAGRSNTGQK